MHRPQLCWLPPQMVPQQMQMGMPPQIHLGAAATGSPQHQQHQQYQQHLQCPQHPQHHYVGGCHGQSPLQPAQLGSPPPLACADTPSDAHISEQVTHLLLTSPSAIRYLLWRYLLWSGDAAAQEANDRPAEGDL